MKHLPLLLALFLAAFFPKNLSAQVSFGQAEKFNNDWLFLLSDDPAFSKPGTNDADWRKLSLPHDWSIEGQASRDLASCTGYLPGGIAWYRKHFVWNAEFGMQNAELGMQNAEGGMQNAELEINSRGEAKNSAFCIQNSALTKLYIYFEGVYNRSEVYLNGHLLGKRPNGYISFLYDMTPYLREGENVLSVRVDHSRYADSRWYTGSGIYRDVWLVRAPEVHFAQWGVGYKAVQLTDKEATILMDAAIEGKASGSLKVKAEWIDAKGKVVATAQGTPRDGKTVLTLKVKKPIRWDIDNPYLYVLRAILTEDGKEIDRCELSAGLRTLAFSPDHGFALNGRNMKVKGVCLHHDAGCLGAVVPEQVWERRLLRLKEIGVNAIRCAHNPQAPVLYDLCDRLGLLVMDEASDEWEFPKRKWVEGWNVGTPSYDGTFDFFEEWIDRDVTDMVRRDRHHPSIFLWSIGNEVDYPNDPYSHPILDGGNATINQPMFGGYDPERPNAERIGKIAKRLAACVRAVDDSRPVTGALAGVVMSNETEYPEAVDVVGYNYTENRYDEDHRTYPERVIYGSENGVGYDAWLAVRDKDFIFGQFIWTGMDYLGESGRWPSRGLNTGLLDFGSFAKPRGHFRASLWAEQPVCYAGTYPLRRNSRQGRQMGGGQVSAEAMDTWNYTEGQTVRVVCYTNSPQARLLLNGKEVGERKAKDPKNGIVYWDVPFEAGELTAVGVSAEGKDEARYSIYTTGRPVSLRVRFDNAATKREQSSLLGLPSGSRGGGANAKGEEADNSLDGLNHLLVEVLDEQGHVVRMASNEIVCDIEGPATLLGLEGSNNTDMGDYRDNRQRAHNGRLLAYVRNQKSAGTVNVRFSAEGLEGASISYQIELGN